MNIIKFTCINDYYSDDYNYNDYYSKELSPQLSENLDNFEFRIGFEKWLIKHISPSKALEEDFAWYSRMIALLCTKAYNAPAGDKAREDLLIAHLISKTDPVKPGQRGRLAAVARLVHHSTGMALNLTPICSALKGSHMPHTHTVLLKRMLQHQTLDAIFKQAWNDNDLSLLNVIHNHSPKEFATLVQRQVQEIQDKKCTTPLHLAAQSNHLVLTKALLAAAPTIALMQDDKDERTALHFAAANGFTKIAELIIQAAPGSASKQNKYRATPLHHAAFFNRLDTVKLLLTAAPHTALMKDEWEATALCLALAKGFTEIAQFIAEKVPDILNVLDKDNYDTYIRAKLFRPDNYKKITQLYHSQSKERKELSTIIMQRKLLGHVWEIKGQSVVIKPKTKETVFSIDLEWHAPPQWYQFMKKHLNMIERDALFSKEQSSLIKHLFDLGANPTSYSIKDRIQRIEAGLPVVISSGYSGHEVTLLIWKDMFVICNRGGASRKPIEIFHFGKKIDAAVLEEIQKIRSFGTVVDYENLMFHKLPAGLQFSHSDWDLILEEYNLLPTQIIGNCSFLSPATAIYVFLLLSEVFGIDEDGALKELPVSYPWEQLQQNINKAFQTYNAWLSDLQMSILEKNLQKSDTYELDHQLILQALRKAQQAPLSDASNEKLEKLTSNYLGTLDDTEHAFVSADLSFWKHMKKADEFLALLGKETAGT
jgi:hypothetical protein